MKTLFFVLALLILSNCASQTSADKIGNDTPYPKPTIDNANIPNVNQWTPPPDEPVDKAKLEKLEKQNAPFKVVPEEFSKVDFKNFNYSSSREKKIIPLKNGSYEYEYKGNGCIVCGGEKYYLSDVYFLDLTGDAKKEAIVLLSVLSCGGSCDGGAKFSYVYSIVKNNPKLIWRFETGSLGYGMGLKSFTVRDKKIIIEQFGGYISKKDEKKGIGMNKFHSENTTLSIFGFNGKKITQEKQEIISVPTRNVMNYLAEISINE